MKPLFPRICLVSSHVNPSIRIYIIFLYLLNNNHICRKMIIASMSNSFSAHTQFQSMSNQTENKNHSVVREYTTKKIILLIWDSFRVRVKTKKAWRDMWSLSKHTLSSLCFTVMTTLLPILSCHFSKIIFTLLRFLLSLISNSCSTIIPFLSALSFLLHVILAFVQHLPLFPSSAFVKQTKSLDSQVNSTFLNFCSQTLY